MKSIPESAVPLEQIRRFLQQHLQPDITRLVLAYSGGMDSRALLHALMALAFEHQRPVLAVHVHHGLSAHADDWAIHAEQTAQRYGVACLVKKVQIETAASLEAAARTARYQALNSVLQPGDVLLLAHHQNDQAETVLLRLLRGSGVRGLAAMTETGITPFHSQNIPCWRPWLTVSRSAIADFAQQQALSWVEDDSNTNTAFSRNYLRHQILPVLEQRWPQAAHQLAQTSQRMSEAEELLQDLALLDYRQVKAGQGALNIQALGELSQARRNNVLRYWLQHLALPLPDHADIVRIWNEVCLAKVDATPLLAWAGAEVRRYRNQLYAMPPLSDFDEGIVLPWQDKATPLTLPTGQQLQPEDVCAGLNALQWRSGQVTVGFRRGGEKIRPVGRQHHHDLKKLLQAEAVPPWQRARIPLLYINQQLAAVIGYWVAHEFAD